MNWKIRLERAKKKLGFTKQDKSLSEKFKTCAIGEKLNLKNVIVSEYGYNWEKHFRDECGIRKGNEIYQFGVDFYTAIDDGSIVEANRIYKEIQKLKVV